MRWQIDAQVRTTTLRRPAAAAGTLLLSHVSRDHLVFAQDDTGYGDSLNRVKESPLLNPGVVRSVEGETQLTLPRHDFGAEQFDLVLLDGPHGFPFPALEYYYFYPRVRTGGILIIDDIRIPSVRDMFHFLRKDAMWHRDAVVGQTAFFTRTDAPTVDPLGDGWWLQGYNRQPLWYRTMQKAKQQAPPLVKTAYRKISG